MANVTLVTGYSWLAPAAISTVLPQLTFALDFVDAGSASATFSAAAPVVAPVSGEITELQAKVDLANAFVLSGVSFTAAGAHHVMKANGDIHRDLSPVTGNGTKVGTIAPALGQIKLTSWAAGTSPVIADWRGVAAAPVTGPDTAYGAYMVTFRTAMAPLRPQSITILGELLDSTTINVAADAAGRINTTRVKGRINYSTGVTHLVFVTPTAPDGAVQADLSFLDIPGVGLAYVDLARTETLRYSAVGYTYLPLDAELLGIDPVRLPSDGRVPIFRKGEFVVVGNTKKTAPFVAVAGTTEDVGRTRLARARVRDAAGHIIHTGYTAALQTWLVAITDVTDWLQPVTIEHRVEDMSRLRDAQIDGTLTLMRSLTHDYTAGDSYVSSALVLSDLRARVPLVFDQESWDGKFADQVWGDSAVASYNQDYPIEVTNAGAVTERWVLRFKTSTTYECIGEHVGNIGDGSINADFSPMNLQAGAPYMTVRAIGFNVGWVPGNILRINTVGALGDVWAARTVRQGPETALDDSVTLLVRCDVDRPPV